MFKLAGKKKAQSIMEYALLFSIVIAAFTIMQLYVRRGINAKIKEGTDSLPGIVTGQAGGEATQVFGDTTQYEPYYSAKGSSEYTTESQEGTETGMMSREGGKRVLAGETQKRTGTQTIVGTDESD